MRRKICFIVSSPYTAWFLKNHLEALNKKFDLYLVANINDKNKDALNFVSFSQYKCIKIERSIKLMSDIKATHELFKYLKSQKFDAIHSITPKAGLIASIASYFARTPNRIHIFTGQVWATKKGFSRLFLKWLDKIIVLLNTIILVDGYSQLSFLRQETVLSKKKGVVLGAGSICGVNTSVFKPNSDVREQIRKELNISEDIVVFLFMGRMNVDKGIIDLAHAFNKLTINNSNVFLLLVGSDEGNMLQVINRIISNKNTYRYIGSTNNPEKYFQACDVFCLPSYREGFGMSVIEASATKTPVICSNAYGLLDTIVDNKTGLRHHVKDVDDLLKQMEKLATDKQLRNFLGTNGRNYIKDNFSAQAITKAWLEFYTKMLK